MSPPAPRYAVLLLVLGSGLAALALDGVALGHPVLVGDDFQILVRSWTWRGAVDSLWEPHNEHVMPLGRLTTWALAALAGPAANRPRVLLGQGPLAVLLGMGLLYRFVRRECAHPLYGLLAAALFGVSSVYQQAVFWFSASFSVLALDTALLALLAAQSWRQTGRVRHLLLAAGWAALAPGWFAIGILAGPLCCLYLLPPEKAGAAGPPLPRLVRHVLAALVPLLGSAAFLAVSLPRTAERILHLPHYGDHKTALQAFHLDTGLLYTCRSLVDNLFLGVFGVSTWPGVVCPLPVVFAALALLALAGAWWWRGAPHRRLLLLGLGFILGNYLLVYGARAEWSYVVQLHTWSRYHLFPQLGLALFVCGGVPRWEGGRLRLLPAGVLSGRQFRALAALVGVLFLVQSPRGAIGAWLWTRGYAEQQRVLRQIDAMDARCRQLHIDRDTAREALPPLEVPESWGRENGWLLLRGSADPRPVGVEEARRLLEQGMSRLRLGMKMLSRKRLAGQPRSGFAPMVLSPRCVPPGARPPRTVPPVARPSAGVPPTAPPACPA